MVTSFTDNFYKQVLSVTLGKVPRPQRPPGLKSRTSKVSSWTENAIFTVRNSSYGKVMFLQVFVKNSVHGEGACMAGGHV